MIQDQFYYIFYVCQKRIHKVNMGFLFIKIETTFVADPHQDFNKLLFSVNKLIHVWIKSVTCWKYKKVFRKIFGNVFYNVTLDLRQWIGVFTGPNYLVLLLVTPNVTYGLSFDVSKYSSSKPTNDSKDFINSDVFWYLRNRLLIVTGYMVTSVKL